MHLITLINSFAVSVAVVLMSVVIWGLRGSLSVRSNKAAYYLAVALIIFSAKFILRGFVWDMMVPFLIYMGYDDLVTSMYYYRPVINIVFTIMTIWAAILIHLSLYCSIPAEDRIYWSKWTAWKYPAGRKIIKGQEIDDE